jgi:hypothetical protein
MEIRRDEVGGEQETLGTWGRQRVLVGQSEDRSAVSMPTGSRLLQMLKYQVFPGILLGSSLD